MKQTRTGTSSPLYQIKDKYVPKPRVALRGPTQLESRGNGLRSALFLRRTTVPFDPDRQA
jgi:hypothetical protein